MQDGRPSATAFAVATLRAHHHLSAPAPRILDDRLAMKLAGLTSAQEVSAHVESFVDHLARYCDRPVAVTAIESLMITTCSRSRFMEDQLARSLARGMKQLVILGAGLESTPYRCPQLTDGLAVFEVDYPATQGWKRDRLTALGIQVPANLAFAPLDFERQTLSNALADGGVRRDEMTFFAWLGVQAYLDHKVVLSTLDAVAAFPSGSELVLDLAVPGQSPADREMELAGGEVVASLGEPFRSGYAPDDFEALLRRRGFTQVEIMSVNDWLSRSGFEGRFSAGRGLARLVTAQL